MKQNADEPQRCGEEKDEAGGFRHNIGCRDRAVDSADVIIKLHGGIADETIAVGKAVAIPRRTPAILDMPEAADLVRRSRL